MNASKVRRLGDLATIVRGTVPAKPTDSPEGVPFIGIAEISAGGSAQPRLVNLDNGATGGEQYAKDLHNHVFVEVEDVAVALMSNIGKSVLVTSRHAGAVLGRECAVVRPATAEVKGAWIYVWTQSAQFRDEVVRHTSGTTMPRLSYRALADLRLPVPPLERQQHTEALLEEFDDAFARLGEVQACITELRTLKMELLLADVEDHR